jgi:DNA replication protein DnaC
VSKSLNTRSGRRGSLLAAELDERERNTVQRRLHDARLPRMKTLEEFDFAQSPKISPGQMQELAQGGYIERAEPIIFIGDCDRATFCTSSLHHSKQD